MSDPREAQEQVLLVTHLLRIVDARRVKVGKRVVDDYYVGLPDDTILQLFDGFERVSEDALPKVIDSCQFAVQNKEPYKSQGFTFRHNLRS